MERILVTVLPSRERRRPIRLLEHHVHVNAFGEELAHVVSAMSSIGFRYKPATIFSSGSAGFSSGKAGYIGLFSKSVTNYKERDLAFEKALKSIQSLDDFRGYVESETLSTEMVSRFEPASFHTCEPFPMSRPRMISGRKRADIHVYLPAELPTGDLDSILLAHSFFEVRTNSKRIFTLELQPATDAKLLYLQLKSYFEKAGGAVEIECEIVGKLMLANNKFTLRDIAACIA
jgi:hypothetical protein